MTGRALLTCIVPTVGRSPQLASCLRALEADSGGEVLLVAEEGLELAELAEIPGLRHLSVPPGAGFAKACNRGLAEARSEFVALVNDDALVSPDWSTELLRTLRDHPEIAAVQGTNLQLDPNDRVDGCGIVWNRSWQAVQLDRGASPHVGGPIREIFGVSGTAAMFRAAALDKVVLPNGSHFEPRLGSYYEDVELACRLRSQGFHSAHVPTVVARHQGGASTITAQRWRWTRIYGNRLLVLARLWGRSFPQRVPMLAIRDLADLMHGLARVDWDRVVGIVAGWGLAAKNSGYFIHRGQPLLPMSELQRFRIGTARGVHRP